MSVAGRFEPRGVCVQRGLVVLAAARWPGMWERCERYDLGDRGPGSCAAARPTTSGDGSVGSDRRRKKLPIPATPFIKPIGIARPSAEGSQPSRSATAAPARATRPQSSSSAGVSLPSARKAKDKISAVPVAVAPQGGYAGCGHGGYGVAVGGGAELPVQEGGQPPCLVVRIAGHGLVLGKQDGGLVSGGAQDRAHHVLPAQQIARQRHL